MHESGARLQLAIIADDLTGALDAAAPFARRRLATKVVADPDDLGSALVEQPAVISVTTRSRDMAPEQAGRVVEWVVKALPTGIRIFKKVDSRLKGNIEAELTAFPAERLLVLPAIPEFGRVVREGRLSGFGVDAPISVAAALGRHVGRAMIPDTETEEDVERALSAAEDRLWVGARGLAEALAKMISDTVTPCKLPPRINATIVVGSRDPVTLDQVNALRSFHPDLRYIPAPNGRVGEIVSEDPTSRLTLLQATPEGASASGEEVATALAESLCRTSLDGRNMLVLTGGATAEKVLSHLGIGRMEVLGEFLPGLPVSEAKGFVLITKSGGFGDTDALKKIADHVCAG